MKIRSLFLALLLLPATLSTAWADKGMWLLNELTKQNIERMRELGFTMPMEQLYSLDKPSLANAVVIFGRGCTGITVSNEGLIFTNHHCGYDAIQSQSSVEHDYLRDGFVSQSFEQELPIPGLQVSYLKEIVDVTDQVNAAVAGITDEMERMQKIDQFGEQLEKQYATDEFISAQMTPYYAGNKYYMVVYNVFRDVRMVFAPPSSVGKFGGDTDNWMWPRHTGDFSVFRVYAGEGNKPANYSTSNKPYKPVYYAKVSLNGYKLGDYAMTIGFPGSTNRYLTSWGVEDVMQNENAPRIEVRGAKQAIWKEAMEADQATRIKYASKYAGSANYWKNAIGMNRGLTKLRILDRKRAEEKAFTEWVAKTGKQAQYGHLLEDMRKAYEKVATQQRTFNYFYESMWGGTELPRMANMANMLSERMDSNPQVADNMKKHIKDTYKDYSPALDKKVLPAMLNLFRKHGGDKVLPDVYKLIDKKFKGSAERYAEYVFDKSVIPYEDRLDAVLKMSAKSRSKAMAKDPAVELAMNITKAFTSLQQEMMPDVLQIAKYKRELFAAQRMMDPEKPMPSDANFTMRMSYGEVGGYEPQDGAYYNYYTTEKGVFEKEDPTSSEFSVQPELLNLLRKKDFGQYGVNGDLHLCFLSNNDITGGNSGSPVFDGNGDLIGLAFDGNWEAMSGDIEFEPELQRTINVDIRYVLFIIDKWGGCKRLIDEINFVEKTGDRSMMVSSCSADKAKKGCCKEKVTSCPKMANSCCKDGKKEAKNTLKSCCKEAKKDAKEAIEACCKEGKKACKNMAKACKNMAKTCTKKAEKILTQKK